MGDPRKNIKLEQETWEQLRDEKDPAETWDEFLLGLVERVPRQAETVQLQEEQIDDIARTTVETMKEYELEPDDHQR